MTSRTKFDPSLPECDGALLARVQEGDLSALGVLYDRHYAAVLRFALCTLHDKSEAEDIVQEVFLTAARVASSFDLRPSSRAWLVLDRSRRSARFLRCVQRLGQHTDETGPELPVETLLQRELRAELTRVLDKLTPHKRVVIVLAEVEGLSGPEIAETLGIPVGTVWTRLHHARHALRAQLRSSFRSRAAPPQDAVQQAQAVRLGAGRLASSQPGQASDPDSDVRTAPPRRRLRAKITCKNALNWRVAGRPSGVGVDVGSRAPSCAANDLRLQ